MNRNRNQNILLVEILIAVLFFALCAGVILETFAAAREYERRSRIETQALIDMQNITEAAYASEAVERTLEENGYVLDGSVWKLDTGDYICEMTVTREEASAGIVRSTLVKAIRNGKTIAEIPGARYLPGGERE